MKSVPSLKELLIPVVEALKALGGSGSLQEINDKVIELLQIPDEIAGILHGRKADETRLQNTLGWARTHLKTAGILENPKRGLWVLAPGQWDGNINPDLIVQQNMEKLQSQKKARQKNSAEAGKSGAPLDEEESWRDELSTVLTETLSPDAFERLAQRLLRECGFVKVQVTGRSGDGGIDGTGIAKVNDLMSFHVIFQCKRQKSRVTPGAMRDFRGAMAGRTDKGLFITTASFTEDAQKEANRDGPPPIDLIDGEQLMDKLKELRLGIEVETVEKVTIDKNWYQDI